MIYINEDKWDDIKRDFLDSIEYEVSEEPLVYFDHKTNTQEEIGIRETYEFSKNNMDYMLILDKEHRLTKTSSEKGGKLKEHYSRSPDEFSYKLSVKYRDLDGSWKDSSSLETNLEQ
ncbi:MAG: hypothetical protein WC843_04020 [Candidatus Gracilibacteria bacterium]|jgi:hypothetical protein